MKTKDKIAFVAMAVAFVAGGFRLGWGVCLHSPWWTHLAFQFTHGNIFHLAGNLLAVWLYCKSGRVTTKMWCIAFAIASTISLLYLFDKPLVGFSGTIMAVSGMFLPYIWKRSGKQFLLALSACSLFSLLFGQWTAVLFHFLALLLGVLYTQTKRLNDDYRRENKRTQGRTHSA